MNELYEFWAKFCGNGNLAEEFPMKPATDKIYYFAYNYKAQTRVELVNLTINLKVKRFLETE